MAQFVGYRSLALKAGKLPEARKDYKQALTLRKELGENDGIAQAQVALSEILLEEGKGLEAEAAIRTARDHLHDVGLKDDELSATAVLVRTQLAQNKVNDAVRELCASSQFCPPLHSTTWGGESQIESAIKFATMLELFRLWLGAFCRIFCTHKPSC